jgi:lysophospholipase L1-like esterase
MRATSRSSAPRRYAALGDSFSAGAAAGDAPGFADRLAELLGASDYRNLATPGALTADVVRHQLPSALAFEPDTITIVCGGNDALLEVRPDVRAHSAWFERALGSLRLMLPGAAIATATTPDPARFLALRPRSAARVSRAIAAVNEATRWSARRHDVALLDVADHPESALRTNYDADGYHPAPAAAERTAEAFAQLFGIDLDKQEAS